MTIRSFCAMAAIVAALAFAGGYAVSQDAPGQAEAPGQPSPAEMQEMMAKWLATIEPGPEHELLAKSVGKWNTTTRIWMAGPGTPPMESKGTSTNESILGGRFVLQRMNGKMPMPGADGQMQMVDMEGMGVTGFDRVRNIYVGGWIDNMSTQMLTYSGTYNPTTKTFAFYGEMDEPMMDMFGRTVKYETKIESDDKHVFSIYDLAAGDDYKVVEVTYERAE